jgi:aldose 1-epimerase
MLGAHERRGNRMSTLHVIENDFWQVGLLPETGMSTAFGRIRRRGELVDFMRPTDPSHYERSSDCASYLLVPWSNRIARGEFRFRDETYRLEINSDDNTAIHGVVKFYSWNLERVERTRLSATFQSVHPGQAAPGAGRNDGANFPFAFSVRAEFSVDGPRFHHRVTIRNEDTAAMPAGIGHHPYFRRALTAAADEVRVEIPCSRYFPAQKCIPTGPPVPVDARLDFRASRPVGDVFIDDCLTARQAGRPILFSYPQSGVTVALHADEVFEQVVLYAPVGRTFFAVEPVTNANDGFNLFDRGMPGSGVFVLEPGEERSATFTMELTDGA